MTEAVRADLEAKLIGKKYAEHKDSTDNHQSVFSDEDINYPTYRVICPGYMYTCDYCSDRIKIVLDEDYVCTRVTIG